MSVIALITKAQDINHVISWATHFAQALDSSVTVLCWAYVPMVGQDCTRQM